MIPNRRNCPRQTVIQDCLAFWAPKVTQVVLSLAHIDTRNESQFRVEIGAQIQITGLVGPVPVIPREGGRVSSPLKVGLLAGVCLAVEGPDDLSGEEPIRAKLQ